MVVYYCPSEHDNGFLAVNRAIVEGVFAKLYPSLERGGVCCWRKVSVALGWVQSRKRQL